MSGDCLEIQLTIGHYDIINVNQILNTFNKCQWNFNHTFGMITIVIYIFKIQGSVRFFY